MMARARKKQVTTHRLFLWGGGSVVGCIVLFFVVVLCAPRYRSEHGFRNLPDVIAYASAMPEHPAMDNTNMVRPDYTTFHRGQLRGMFRQKLATVLSWLRIYTPATWSPSYFEKILKDTTVRLAQHKVRKNIVYKVAPQPGAQFVIWGDLSGAFHSFVRTLSKLKELSILDDDLRIVADNTYFVCMGDAVSRSAYGMETLSLLLRLQEVNPDRMIYLRGNHEDNKYWHAFGLKDQMGLRLGGDIEAHTTQVDELFFHLPLGLYLPIPGGDGHYVRLSHLGQSRSKKLREERYAHFLGSEQRGTLDRHQFSKSVMHSSKVHIDAVIRSEKKRHNFQATDGLRLLEPDHGATAWTVLSSPTLVQQRGLKFFHDAFALLRVGAHKARWSITLYSQDVRDMGGFSSRSYQFFTGKEMSLEQIADAAKEGSSQAEAAPPKKVQPRFVTQSKQVTQAIRHVPVSSEAKGLVAEQKQAQHNLTTMIKNLSQQKVVRRTSPVKPVAHQSSSQTIVAPTGSESVSVTVTPPQAGAANQATVVSVAVKVPPYQHGTQQASSSSSALPQAQSIQSGPVVRPVVRGQQEIDIGSAVAATAERLEVLEQTPGVADGS